MNVVPEIKARGELSYACACCGSQYWSVEKAKECFMLHEHNSHPDGCDFKGAAFIEMLAFKKKEIEEERADHAKLLRKVIDTPDYVARLSKEFDIYLNDKDAVFQYEILRTTAEDVKEKLVELQNFVKKE